MTSKAITGSDLAMSAAVRPLYLDQRRGMGGFWSAEERGALAHFFFVFDAGFSS